MQSMRKEEQSQIQSHKIIQKRFSCTPNSTISIFLNAIQLRLNSPSSDKTKKSPHQIESIGFYDLHPNRIVPQRTRVTPS